MMCEYLKHLACVHAYMHACMHVYIRACIRVGVPTSMSVWEWAKYSVMPQDLSNCWIHLIWLLLSYLKGLDSTKIAHLFSHSPVQHSVFFQVFTSVAQSFRRFKANTPSPVSRYPDKHDYRASLMAMQHQQMKPNKQGQKSPPVALVQSRIADSLSVQLHQCLRICVNPICLWCYRINAKMS